MPVIYGPLQKKETRRWDYVKFDIFGKPAPIGPSWELYKSGNKDGLAETAEKAVAKFAEWAENKITLDGLNFMRLPCQVCGQKTFRCSTLDGMPFITLCDLHRNRPLVMRLILANPRIMVHEEANEEDPGADPNAGKNIILP